MLLLFERYQETLFVQYLQINQKRNNRISRQLFLFAFPIICLHNSCNRYSVFIIFLRMLPNCRDKVFSAILKLPFQCQLHPQEISKMILESQQTKLISIVCQNCLCQMSAKDPKTKSLQVALVQIHQSCKRLQKDLSVAIFVDYHFGMIKAIVRSQFKYMEAILNLCVDRWFQKYRDLVNGKYFDEFYALGSQITVFPNFTHNLPKYSNQNFSKTKKLANFLNSFYSFVTSYEDYDNMTQDEVMLGENIVKQIKYQVREMYEQLKEKGENVEIYQQDQILQLLEHPLKNIKANRFSTKYIHSSLKIIDPKTFVMNNQQVALISLIQPRIVNKNKSIKLNMNQIKGWAAVGLAIRSQVEANDYEFGKNEPRTYQIMYEGFCWGEGYNTYTNLSFKSNDTLSMTVTPSSKELKFVKNEEEDKAYTVKFKSQEKDKLYFCVTLHKFEDNVSILQ